MRIIIITVFQLISFAIHAQNAPTSLGGTISNDAIEISFAMGEVVVANTNQTNQSIVSGVIQPFTNISVDVKEISTYDLKIFPNPTNTYLNIEQKELIFSEYEIHSIDGKLLMYGIFQNKIEGLEELPSGLYVLRLRNESQIYNSLFEKI